MPIVKPKGKIIKFSQDEVDKISKELDLQHPDLSGSELLKAILKDALGKENVTFEINGNIIRAFISRKGYNHFGVFNNANKANKVFANKMADIINNSEYVYSTKNVPHKNNKATDVQCWDDFLSLTNINDDNFYVLFGLRKMQSEDRHQIYSLTIRSEDSTRNAQESKTDPIANYTDSKPSPNSIITEPEDSWQDR